ncbi:MAG: FAD-binding oxidoreductase [Alphaproteobacteria bacterium]|nr:FAD-binding oxidoreductase [Alphaproteobacteria bacterium]
MTVREDLGVLAWGRAHRGRHVVADPAVRADAGPAARETAKAGGSTLAHGLGRSYGDSGLNLGGGLVRMAGLDRLIAFDRETGLLRADAGISLDALLKVTVPAGWFLPVTPGTKFVTLGGALANDVHGKNHHLAGSFGRHVTRFGLWRSDRGEAGAEIECSPGENANLFALTIGGLGLTGIVTWIEFRLERIPSSHLYVENIPVDGLDAFFDLAERSLDWPFTVAWVDTLARGDRLGRGIFSRASWAEGGGFTAHSGGGPRMPIDAPGGLLNSVTVGAFNRLYRARPGARFQGRQHYDPFFYPLDRLRDWNRMYGPRGFYQWQCAVPVDSMREATRTLLDTVAASGDASFLAVLKTFGDVPSPGILSFPMPGATLALDFANRGQETLSLLARLDRVVAEVGGRLYPAKDGRLPQAMFRAGFPRWSDLEAVRDPILMSSFWRRMTEEA